MRIVSLPPIITTITSNEPWNTETHKTDRYPPITNHKPWPFEPVEVNFSFPRGPLRWYPFSGESLHWILLKPLYNGRLFTTATFFMPPRCIPKLKDPIEWLGPVKTLNLMHEEGLKRRLFSHGCVFLAKSKSGFPNPKTDFASFWANRKTDHESIKSTLRVDSSDQIQIRIFETHNLSVFLGKDLKKAFLHDKRFFEKTMVRNRCRTFMTF